MKAGLILIASLIMMQPSDKLLLDFSGNDQIPEWFIINDGVMGGVSTSDLKYMSQGSLMFTGNVSLKYNGGFASFRGNMSDLDLKGYDGIKIRVRGDGKKYSFRIRTNNSFDGIAYAADFKSKENVWQEINIPFSDFTPRFRGRIILNAGKLDPAAIKQLGFLISDKQEGPFQLEIDWIKAYQN